jgi:hypothetical protein
MASRSAPSAPKLPYRSMLNLLPSRQAGGKIYYRYNRTVLSPLLPAIKVISSRLPADKDPGCLTSPGSDLPSADLGKASRNRGSRCATSTPSTPCRPGIFFY